jgi:DNA mismatch repair protein MutS2
MAISEHTLETLEFPRIREQLARYTAFSASRELALALVPATECAEVERRLRQTSEARHMLDEHPETTIGGARDIRSLAQRAARGGALEASDMLDIMGTLGSMRRLRGLLGKLSPEIYPLLYDYIEYFPHLPALEDAIADAIDEDGTVRDNATPTLGRLRSEIATTAARMQERLHNLVHAQKFEGVLQEALVTVRNGRYVVPVKAEHRRAVPGLVHDQSASGATLYIEPMAVVEMNNRLRKLQLDEEQEVARILAELSQQVGSASEPIISGVGALAELDLAFAQAHYALALRCVEPQLAPPCGAEQPSAVGGGGGDNAPLVLRQARHPLLNQQTVVPINVWMGAEFRLLLMTGPNTGGKTVALKTVGLLALMAQAGLHIPARSPSRLPVFSHIFSDIGDEQSIEQSLSTFSSHMRTIIHMLRELDTVEEGAEQFPSLVLLDEIGAGTDPVEGSALARAIMEHLLERGCMGMITTHYAELKAFAYNTPGIQNASVEFDAATLAPTYELAIGLPGRSNALAIAARLGLDPAIVERAGSSINQETLRIEGLLEDIHHKREAATAEMQRAEELRRDAEKYRDRLSHEMELFEDTRQEKLDQAMREVQAELREARAELYHMRKELRSEREARQKFQESEQHIQQVEAQVRAVERRQRSARGEVPGEEAPPPPLQPGDKVLVRSIGLTGEIVAIDEQDEMADVQVGGFRVKAGLPELRREKQGDRQPDPPPYQQQRSVSLPPAPDVSMSFDMRGCRTAEVPDLLDPYLNDAYMANLPQVRIIHGKGSGALRQVVHSFLRSHPLVKSFSGGGKDGGEGVTVANLVER